MGHKEGCVTVEKTVEIAARMGIEYLTVYGFSTENWKRPMEEVGALMQLFPLLHGAPLEGGLSQQCAGEDDWGPDPVRPGYH